MSAPMLRFRFLFWMVPGFVPTLAAPFAAQAQFTKPYTVDSIADGVYAVVWEAMAEYPYEGNHLIVETDHGVLVVDANRTPTLADTVIAVVRRHSDQPVRYLVNTHWHADHVQGNATYRRSFPGVEIIGHPETGAGIDTVLVPYIAEVRRDLETVRRQLASETTEAGDPLTGAERGRLTARLDHLERESTLYDQVTLARPTRYITDSLVLHGTPEIRIVHPGHANTPGDLIVHLPALGVIASGDIVTRPYPLLGWDAPRGWARALDNILARFPRVVIPGHGEVLRSMEYVELFRDVFRDLSGQVHAGIEAGQSLAELQTSVHLEPYWREFAGENERTFDAFVTRFQPIAVERAYLEAEAGRH